MGVTQKRKPPGYWTKKRCLETIRASKTYGEWRRNYPPVRAVCLLNGWLKSAIDKLPRVRGRKIYWTMPRIVRAAKSCKTIDEFRTKYPGAYRICWANKIIKSVCAHMAPRGTLYKRAVYKIVFANRSVYIGLTCNIERRYIEHRTKSRLRFYLKRHRHRIVRVTEYIDAKLAQQIEEKTIAQYQKRGWRVLNIAMPGALGGNRVVHTPESAAMAARKFTCKRDFRASEPNIYAYGERHGILNKICSHMKETQWINRRTVEKAKRIARQYSTLKEFYSNSRSVYNWSVNSGHYDEICGHLKRRVRVSLVDPFEVWRIALRYNRRSDFKRANPGLYKWVCAHRLREPIFGHLPVA